MCAREKREHGGRKKNKREVKHDPAKQTIEQLLRRTLYQ